jgi:hypothetical protein
VPYSLAQQAERSRSSSCDRAVRRICAAMLKLKRAWANRSSVSSILELVMARVRSTRRDSGG